MKNKKLKVLKKEQPIKDITLFEKFDEQIFISNKETRVKNRHYQKRDMKKENKH